MKNDHTDRHNGLTPDEQQRLLEIHRERTQEHQAMADNNLAVAMRLGAALKHLHEV